VTFFLETSDPLHVLENSSLYQISTFYQGKLLIFFDKYVCLWQEIKCFDLMKANRRKYNISCRLSTVLQILFGLAIAGSTF